MGLLYLSSPPFFAPVREDWQVPIQKRGVVLQFLPTLVLASKLHFKGARPSGLVVTHTSANLNWDLLNAVFPRSGKEITPQQLPE
jgi:hypothetical protein